MDGAAPLALNRLLAASDIENREAAWEDLIGRHTRLLMAVAHSFGGDNDDTMERYSYILGKLREFEFRRLRTFDPNSGATFSTWLTVAARRLCTDLHRSRYGRTRSAHSDDSSSVVQAARKALNDWSSSDVDTDTLADAALQADSGLIQTNRDECLRAELAQLAPRERLILTLRFADGLPASRIAGILGLSSPFHVYRSLNSILARLRNRLEAQGIEGSDG